ncbi:MAG: response regulator [Clostridia bacterium]|jgi:two-component SAPR family response regulator|nr:response regulator [Clostridia bacterium]
MRTVLVDDEKAPLNYLHGLCKQIPEIEVVETFMNPQFALEYLCKHPVDLVFLDVEMPQISGIDIAKEIQSRGIKTAVVFVTGYEQYALDAFRLDAVSYILKPSEISEVIKAMQKAKRYVVPETQKVFVQTFDHFDVFVNEKPIYFSNTKAKELLAVLIDRQGSIVSMDTIIDLLWPERPYDENVKQLYRKAVNHLNKTLNAYNIHFFVSNRGSCYVHKAEFICDYYQLLEGNEMFIKRFHGEYMFEYSWGENTLIKIKKYLKKHL